MGLSATCGGMLCGGGSMRSDTGKAARVSRWGRDQLEHVERLFESLLEEKFGNMPRKIHSVEKRVVKIATRLFFYIQFIKFRNRILSTFLLFIRLFFLSCAFIC